MSRDRIDISEVVSAGLAGWRTGEPYELVNLAGETIVHQPLRTLFVPHGSLLSAECQVRS